MTLDDLRNIDFNNVGGLPLPVKGVLLLGILLAVLLAGGWFVWKPMLDDLQAAEDTEWGPDKQSGLRKEFETKVGIAGNLPQYKAQLKEAELKSNILLKQLPDKSQMDGLLTDINQAGIGRGLEFELFRPGAEKPSALYAEMPINIRVIGTYQDLGAFASDLGQMSRIVTLGQISISPTSAKDAKGNASSTLAMDAIATTYRALDKNDVPAPSNKRPH